MESIEDILNCTKGKDVLRFFLQIFISDLQTKRFLVTRDEDPDFFSTDPDPAQLKKKFLIRIRLRIRPEIE